MPKKLSFRDAAATVLKDRGPMHYKELTKAVLDAGLAESTGSTPAASMNAMIAVDIKRNGSRSRFVRVKPATFGLRDPEDQVAAESSGELANDEEAAERRVRVPFFPVYAELRHLLRSLPGWRRTDVTGLQSTVAALRGTPQKNVDWTEPDSWIPERLDGQDRKLAAGIWSASGGAVNPRYIYGSWLLMQNYEFLQSDAEGTLQLTEAGGDFLEHPGGKAEVALDEAEGVIKLLSIVADNGPARSGELLDDWAEYLKRRSGFGSDSTFKDTLRRRLNNLIARGLVERRSNMYSTTHAGLEYLQHIGDEDSVGGEQPEIWKLIREQESSVRDSLLEILLDMDPFAFEHLVKRLLVEMDYQNVEVTSPSGDGGVDVVADIELGITAVREVVQVKRHRRPIQRKDLDALRGSLYRFNAVRGTIITTSRYSKGTTEAAFANGAAPITLIDGQKLVDLLIEHGVGVRKRTVELLEIEPGAFADEF